MRTQQTHCNAEKAANILGKSVRTVYNYRDAGELRQEKVGRKMRFVVAQVEALREKLDASGQMETEAQPEEVTTPT